MKTSQNYRLNRPNYGKFSALEEIQNNNRNMGNNSFINSIDICCIRSFKHLKTIKTTQNYQLNRSNYGKSVALERIQNHNSNMEK